ncbi:MAG: CARDB domain-containing protein [Anaerolineae bacterium]|jgi:hypothetical protein
MKKLKRLALAPILGLLLVMAVGEMASRATLVAPPQSVNSGQHFLPPYENARDRFGFDCVTLNGYDVSLLNAGWYSNWGASLNPPRPDRLAYAQIIRFKAGADKHDPSQVTVSPDKARIAQIAAAHPGSLWFMSNEPDSVYQGIPILPEVYAIVYHDFYKYIKALDPSALIANGGIVQPTPCRMEYLDIVWNTYRETYGEPMPVDVWNIHAFVLREVYNSWGASTPPGVDPSCAMDYTVEQADDLDIFWDNIRAMRTWMKEKGYQDRPLIISEYGILWPQWWAPQFTSQRVSHFMTQTFDLFLHTTDPEIGYPDDDHRLVQTWAWYSLSDDQQYNGALFNSSNKSISTIGVNYATYTAALSDTPQADLSVQLSVDWSDSAPPPAASQSSTVSLGGYIGNLGTLTATDLLARFEVFSHEDSTVTLGHDASYTIAARFDEVIALPPLTTTLIAPGWHELRLLLDPEDQIDELREWNNVATTTLDLRPDLLPSALDYRLALQFGSPGAMAQLAFTSTVHNQGLWPGAAVSATFYLETVPQETLVVSKSLPLPPLAADAQVSLVTGLTWQPLGHDLYRLRVALDEQGQLVEQDVANNQRSWQIPIVVSAELAPTATTVLTSFGGGVQIALSAGGTVITPVTVIYTPWWPSQIPPTLNPAPLGFALTTVPEMPLARPISITWRYGDGGTAGLAEEELRLFVQGEDSGWQDAACEPYVRGLALDQITASICETGHFVFGTRYDLYLPLSLKISLPTVRAEMSSPLPEMNLPPRLSPPK